MHRVHWTVTGVVIGAILIGFSSVFVGLAGASKEGDGIRHRLDSLQSLPGAISEFTPPKFDKPTWYQEQEKAESAKKRGGGRVVTYTVSTRGAVSSDLGVFATQVNETLNSPYGWSQLGISFQQVQSSGSFNLILSEASQVPTFSSGCSADWSCRVGSSVIINDLRWRGATPAWNSAGGSLRDYRHMVVNHEVGHWLGHGHSYCSAPGASAPVMQQQSMNLQGCTFNPWPQSGELWSSMLGIG